MIDTEVLALKMNYVHMNTNVNFTYSCNFKNRQKYDRRHYVEVAVTVVAASMIHTGGTRTEEYR